jgi:acyl-CoA dehydrogenase
MFARTGEAPGAKGLSAFIVPADSPGLEVAERIEMISPHPIARLRLRACRVAPWQLLGQPGEGFRIAMATLDVFRTTVAAAALGMARRALDEASKHAAKRIAMGRLLIEHQLIQGKIADMCCAVDQSALLVYRSAWTRDVLKQRVTRESSMAKLCATESAQRVIDEAVQIFGGIGVQSGTPVEELYRDIRALRIYEGASEIQRVIIARHHMLGLSPGEPR